MCKVNNVGREWGAVPCDWIRDVKRGMFRNKRQVEIRYEGLGYFQDIHFSLRAVRRKKKILTFQ